MGPPPPRRRRPRSSPRTRAGAVGGPLPRLAGALALIPVGPESYSPASMRTPRLRRPRRRPRAIDAAFARILAGQVAAGLAPSGEPRSADDLERYRQVTADLGRARSALTAIGIMLNAATDDAAVREVLDVAGTAYVHAS